VGHGCEARLCMCRSFLQRVDCHPSQHHFHSYGVSTADLDLSRFDTVKTRMQCAAPGVYHGALDVLVKTIRKEVRMAAIPDLVSSQWLC